MGKKSNSSNFYKRKAEHYSTLKTILRVALVIGVGLSITISLIALTIALDAKSDAKWISDKQDNIIEKFYFPDKD